jgi:hypothetical protein
VKASNELNLNTENEHRIKKENNAKLKKINILDKEKNIGIFRLICIDAFNLRKNSTPKKLGFYHFYFNNFIEFCDKKFSVFNYLKVCEEFENVKEILFEDYANIFTNIRPIIELDEFGMKPVSSFNDHELTRIINTKVDRIFKNLFSKLEKK